MTQDTSATGGMEGWQPVCPLCGRVGYGWHDGTTAYDGHYFSPPPFSYSLYVEELKREITEKPDGRIVI